MAVKQLIRANKIKNLNDELRPYKEREATLREEIENISKDLEENDYSEEELEVVSTEVDAKEAELKEQEEKISELEAKIQELTEENDTESERAKQNVNEERNRVVAPVEATGEKEERKAMTKREQKLAYLRQDNVREFYGKIRDVILQKRAITEADLVIPVEVIDNVLPWIFEESVFYKEVNVVKLNGSARAILEGENPEAIWTEMCDPVQELALSFSAIEIDGYKVGGYIPVCNAIIEDSMINLADYIERKLATAIAKALDKAIIAGTGSAGHQPEGIINGREAVALTDNELNTILKSIGDLKSDNLGTVKIAMRRSDFFGKIFDQLTVLTQDGKYVAPLMINPNVAGIDIIFSDYVPEGSMIIGDFKKYLLGERSGNKFAVSTDVRFIEDETVFKMTARYDGKPVNAEYFGYYTFAV